MAWLSPTPWLDGAIPAVLLFEEPTSCSTSPAGGHRTLRDCSGCPDRHLPSTHLLRSIAPATYGRARSWPWLPHLVAGTVLAGVVNTSGRGDAGSALHDKREGIPTVYGACSRRSPYSNRLPRRPCVGGSRLSLNGLVDATWSTSASERPSSILTDDALAPRPQRDHSYPQRPTTPAPGSGPRRCMPQRPRGAAVGCSGTPG